MTLRNALNGLALLALTAVPGRASPQSVSDVVDQMYAAYERNTAGIDDYTVVQSAMGTRSVSYFERETVDGMSLFRARASSVASYSFRLDGRLVGYGDVLIFGPLLKKLGRYSGTDRIDGRQVHVVDVNDLEGLVLVGPSGAGDVEFVPRSARVLVDTELAVPRAFEFRGEAPNAETEGEVEIFVHMSDFRAVSGLLLPHFTRIEVHGGEGVVDADTRARLDEIRKQLEEMPAVQRELMEEMLAEEMEALRKVLGEPGEPTVIEVAVLEVRVNAGPPGADRGDGR